MLGEILKLHMESAIIKAIAPLQEELKKIKVLNATILKEARQAPQVGTYQQTTPTFNLLGKAPGNEILTESVNIQHQQTPGADMYDNPALKGIAMHAKAANGLPDIDLPVPTIFKRQ